MGKYKPLKSPAVCVYCKRKTVCHAYHVSCQECSERRDICAKCRGADEIVQDFCAPEASVNTGRKPDAENMCAEYATGMKERQRRTFLRLAGRGFSVDEALEKISSLRSQDGSETISECDEGDP